MELNDRRTMERAQDELSPYVLGAKPCRRCCCKQIKDLGCKAGVVLNPATPLSAIENVLSFVGASDKHANQ